MKISYIANIRIPTEKAHGLQIMKMCETFSLAGVNTELIVPARKNHILNDPFDYYKIKNVFKIKKLFSIDPVFLYAFPKGFYIKFQSVFFIISLFLYFLFKKHNNGSILYTRDEILLPILHLLSDKVVWETHSLPKNNKIYHRSWKKCFRILCLTEIIKKDLVGFGINESRIIVSPDAVDLKIFDISEDRGQARKILNLPLDKIILGYTGSFKTKGMDKGITDIIKAVKLLLKKRDDVLFYAVGGSDEDIDFYKKIAAENGILERIEFVQRLGQDKVALYQKGFDILLMPFPFNNHYAYYMSPLKLFEYLAAKRPIIASDLPSIREVLNESNCLFCLPDNPADLAEKIDRLLQNPDLGERISAQAYKDSKQYSWEEKTRKIIEFIDK